MHETDMTKALITTVRDWWTEQPRPPHITHIHLAVGEFAGVEPQSLEFAFASQKQNTFLAAAELVIEEIPLVAYCRPCNQEYRPRVGLEYSCPSCRGPMAEIRSGRELKIQHIQYQEAYAPNL